MFKEKSSTLEQKYTLYDFLLVVHLKYCMQKGAETCVHSIIRYYTKTAIFLAFPCVIVHIMWNADDGQLAILFHTKTSGKNSSLFM